MSAAIGHLAAFEVAAVILGGAFVGYGMEPPNTVAGWIGMTGLAMILWATCWRRA